MTPALADEAALAFTVALTVLLAASVLTVIRQPPWIPPPPAEERPRYPGDARGGRAGTAALRRPSRRPRTPGRRSPPAGRDGMRPGQPDETARAPLPVRSPGRSGWTAPLSRRGGPPGRPPPGHLLAAPGGRRPALGARAEAPGRRLAPR